MTIHYRYAWMKHAWVRRPLMILLTIPLTIYVCYQILHEELHGFIGEWLETWRGDE